MKDNYEEEVDQKELVRAESGFEDLSISRIFLPGNQDRILMKYQT